MKRIFDILVSILSLMALFPVMLMIAIWILIDSRGGVFFKQIRVGRNNKNFKMLKFRSMQPDSEKKGMLTVGGRDPRITSAGYYLRKSKLDELPQLLNIFIGDMSFVGPRPEVRKYVDLYTPEQMQVLRVRPGLTDPASLQYFDENVLLEKSDEPEKVYIKSIMPAKLEINLKYMAERSFASDIKVILKTVYRIFS